MQGHTDLTAYARPRISSSLLDLATSVVPYLALTALMYAIYDQVSVLADPRPRRFPTAGFLLRTFIVFHDCGHGSFLRLEAGQPWFGRFTAACSSGSRSPTGATTTPSTTAAPATSTAAAPATSPRSPSRSTTRAWRGRLGYRLFRNPLVMFGIGPIWSLMVAPRLARATSARACATASCSPTSRSRRWSRALCLLFGWQRFLLVQLPAALLAGSAGVWLFYVQHQFEDVYWETRRPLELRRRGAAGQLLPEAAEGAAVLHRQHRPPSRPPPERQGPELQPPARPRREPDLPRRSGAHAARLLRARG